MTAVNLAAVCGLFCGECKHLGLKCRGCGQQKGKRALCTHHKKEKGEIKQYIVAYL
jgi:hypothetical protein